MSRTDNERTFGGRRRWAQLPLSWAGIIFAAVVVTAFAVSIESGRPAWEASGIALITAFLAVAGVVVLDAVASRKGVRIVVHVLPVLFVLFLAFLLTALQFADRLLIPPLYVVLVGHWIVGFSLILGGVFVSRGATHWVYRVAYVGLGASLVWALVATGYAVVMLITRGWNVASGITAGAVSGWLLLLALVVGPSLVFLWTSARRLRNVRIRWTRDEQDNAARLPEAAVTIVEQDQPMRLDALQQRVQIPLPWAVTIFAVITVGVFAGTWLSGSPIWLVVLSTLLAAVLTGVSLTTTGPILRNRIFRLVAHAVLGLFVLIVALFITLLSAAAGALTLSLENVIVLGNLLGLGLALILSGLSIFLDANRLLRRIATLGLGLTVVWGLIVAVLLGGVIVHIPLEGFDLAIVQDLQDDLIPFLVVSIAFVVLLAIVFRQDLQEVRTKEMA